MAICSYRRALWARYCSAALHFPQETQLDTREFQSVGAKCRNCCCWMKSEVLWGSLRFSEVLLASGVAPCQSNISGCDEAGFHSNSSFYSPWQTASFLTVFFPFTNQDRTYTVRSSGGLWKVTCDVLLLLWNPLWCFCPLCPEQRSTDWAGCLIWAETDCQDGSSVMNECINT